jgi:hypothetical protein
MAVVQCGPVLNKKVRKDLKHVTSELGVSERVRPAYCGGREF